MPLIPFGEYAPDVPDLAHARGAAMTTQAVLNAVPIATGYGPFQAFTAYTTALPAACRGYFHARKSDGSIAVFAGTATRLYLLDNTDFGWTDVSKSGGSYSAVPTGDQWQFAQHGNLVLATQINTVVQSFNLSSSSQFADLGGAPPQARYISIVVRFVVLSGLSSDPYAIRWSGNNAPATWTAGTLESDSQTFPDGGPVRGVAGGQSGIVLQDGALRRMTYAPGSATIFTIDRISEDHGILAPLSLVRGGDQFFFLGTQGFQKCGPTGYPSPIGKERVDRTVLADIDTGALQSMIGAADPRATRVYWAYKSLAGQSGLFDRVLAYDYALDRFAPLAISGQYIASLSKPGLTLENLDAIAPGGSLDALPFSLDDVSTATLSRLSAVNGGNVLGFFDGAPLEATFETPEQGADDRRIHVHGFRPVTDAAALFGALGRRETLSAARTWTAEAATNAYGIVPFDKSTRYARARVRIPAGEAWTHATGVEPQFRTAGSR